MRIIFIVLWISVTCNFSIHMVVNGSSPVPPPGSIVNLARGKPTKQSSICCGGSPGRAVDGNNNSQWSGGSCSHTNTQYGAWWRVDLGQPYPIDKVKLTNRGDCCWDRLSGFDVRVGNVDDNPDLNALCYRYYGIVGRAQTEEIKCTEPTPRGRFVYVKLNGINPLTLCEVEVMAAGTPYSASESICEHTPGTTIRCPTGYNINVRYANYGRLTTASSVGCPTGPQSINCRTSGSLQIVQNLCNGKQYCTLTASNSIFGDPCHGVRKVLDVTYECKIGPFSTTPNLPKENGFCVKSNGLDQNSGVIKLNNLDGNTFERQAACLRLCSVYQKATGCEVIWNQGNRGCYVHTQEVARGNGVGNHACWIFPKPSNVWEKVTSVSQISGFLVGTSDSSQVTPTNKFFIALKSNHHKWLSAKDDGLTIKNDQMSVGSKEKFEISFTSDGYVNLETWKVKYWSAQPNGVLQANRDHAASWEKFEMYVYGEGVVALKSVHGKWLSAQPDGRVEVNRDNLNSWEKFYPFNQERDATSKSICEHTPGTTITCPTGYSIFVTYANYGRLSTASSVKCPSGRQITNCRAYRSLQIVQKLCNGKLFCTLTAANSVFGDPCLGVRKVLDVTYECRIGTTLTGNIARGKSTRQSSTAAGGSSSRAVDGNKNSQWNERSCTHTNRQRGAWWRVDLGGSYQVGKVKLTNRGDCCWDRLSNFDIRVGNVDNNPDRNTLCYRHSGKVGRAQTKELACTDPTAGRFVYVKLNGNNYLTLCEVEVRAYLRPASLLAEDCGSAELDKLSGTNITKIASFGFLGVFLLLFTLYCCHKRKVRRSPTPKPPEPQPEPQAGDTDANVTENASHEPEMALPALAYYSDAGYRDAPPSYQKATTQRVFSFTSVFPPAIPPLDLPDAPPPTFQEVVANHHSNEENDFDREDSPPPSYEFAVSNVGSNNLRTSTQSVRAIHVTSVGSSETDANSETDARNLSPIPPKDENTGRKVVSLYSAGINLSQINARSVRPGTHHGRRRQSDSEI